MRILALTTLLLASGYAAAQTAAGVEAWYDVVSGEMERRGAVDGAVDEARVNAIEKGLQVTTWGVGTAVAANDLVENWTALDSSEASCGAAYNDAAAPVVPSSCAEDPDCKQCYEEAVREIDFNRFYIERAHCITSAAVKMANSAMAFGDSASGIHGMAGLAWQLDGKPQIQGALDNLRKNYTDKAGQYLKGLERSLRKLGECEAQHYGQKDWFERYGWIYLTFMQSRYQSPPQ
jgi:hypothetical protein